MPSPTPGKRYGVRCVATGFKSDTIGYGSSIRVATERVSAAVAKLLAKNTPGTIIGATFDLVERPHKRTGSLEHLCSTCHSVDHN